MFRWGVGAGTPSVAPKSGRRVPFALPLVVLVLVALPVAGYAITSATAQEAAQGPDGSFAENLSATQSLLGGDWQVRDDSFGRACVLPGGGTGESTPALRIRVLEAAPGADARTSSGAAQTASSTTEPLASVASAWAEWGYSVSRSVIRLSTGDVTEVQARGASGEYLILRANDGAFVLQGESGCNAP